MLMISKPTGYTEEGTIGAQLQSVLNPNMLEKVVSSKVFYTPGKYDACTSTSIFIAFSRYLILWLPAQDSLKCILEKDQSINSTSIPTSFIASASDDNWDFAFSILSGAAVD